MGLITGSFFCRLDKEVKSASSELCDEKDARIGDSLYVFS